MTAARTTHHAPRTASYDLAELREREFPWTRRGDVIFLNHASTGPLPARAVEALHEATRLRAEPWRYSGELQFGTLARARELCARLIGATPDEIALTTNTTYGLNIAARSLPFAPGDVVVTSDREYPANVYPWHALEKSRGVSLRLVPCAGRLPDEEAILAALDEPRVRALVLSWVTFDTGYRADLERLGRACRERGIWFVVDGIQGLGAATVDVSRLHIDIFACGGQKWLLSPWGTGFVYLRRELAQSLEPTMVSWLATRGTEGEDFSRLLDYDFAWRPDARRFEMITLPYQDFAGMNASLELFVELGVECVAARVAALADRIVDWARNRSDVMLITPADRARRAGIVSLVPPDAAAATARLSAAGVVHSLREGAVRLSPHCYTSEGEIDRALAVLGGH